MIHSVNADDGADNRVYFIRWQLLVHGVDGYGGG